MDGGTFDGRPASGKRWQILPINLTTSEVIQYCIRVRPLEVNRANGENGKHSCVRADQSTLRTSASHAQKETRRKARFCQSRI